MFAQWHPYLCLECTYHLVLKWQNTVEGATFGSELVAHRICKDLIVVL